MKTLKLNIEETDNHTWISLSGDIVGVEAFDLKQELKKYGARNKDLMIDLREVNEISLTGLNSILISNAYANSKNNSLTLIVKKECKILEHLHITKMTDQFIINKVA